MENHRHAKHTKKQHKYTQYCNNSFIKSYKKVVDKSGQLRYYKYASRRSTDLTKGDGLATVALFCFPTESITHKQRNVKPYSEHLDR